MVDALKGIIVTILLVVTFVVYPAYRQAEKINERTEEVAYAAMVEFVNSSRSKGFIDVQDYKTFLKKLDASRGVFDVKLEYYKKVIQPNYINPDDYSSFQGTFNVRYDGYFTKQILNVMYPQNSLPDDDDSRKFKMHVGDLMNVRIESRGSTLEATIGKLLFNSTNVPINKIYGGMVQSESN